MIARGRFRKVLIALQSSAHLVRRRDEIRGLGRGDLGAQVDHSTVGSRQHATWLDTFERPSYPGCDMVNRLPVDKDIYVSLLMFARAPLTISMRVSDI